MHRKRISSLPPPLLGFMPLPGPSHTLPTTPGSSMGLRGRETLPSFLTQGIIRTQFVGSGWAGGWCLEKKSCPSARPPGRRAALCGPHAWVPAPRRRSGWDKLRGSCLCRSAASRRSHQMPSAVVRRLRLAATRRDHVPSRLQWAAAARGGGTAGAGPRPSFVGRHGETSATRGRALPVCSSG